MLRGTVVGEVWSSVKVADLDGRKLLVITNEATGAEIVAVDIVGAGAGDRVIVALGRAARNAFGRGQDVAVEACVVGVIDGEHPAPVGREVDATGSESDESRKKSTHKKESTTKVSPKTKSTPKKSDKKTTSKNTKKKAAKRSTTSSSATTDTSTDVAPVVVDGDDLQPDSDPEPEKPKKRRATKSRANPRRPNKDDDATGDLFDDFDDMWADTDGGAANDDTSNDNPSDDESSQKE